MVRYKRIDQEFLDICESVMKQYCQHFHKYQSSLSEQGLENYFILKEPIQIDVFFPSIFYKNGGLKDYSKTSIVLGVYFPEAGIGAKSVRDIIPKMEVLNRSANFLEESGYRLVFNAVIKGLDYNCDVPTRNNEDVIRIAKDLGNLEKMIIKRK